MKMQLTYKLIKTDDDEETCINCCFGVNGGKNCIEPSVLDCTDHNITKGKPCYWRQIEAKETTHD